jgi:hypothetical protein
MAISLMSRALPTLKISCPMVTSQPLARRCVQAIQSQISCIVRTQEYVCLCFSGRSLPRGFGLWFVSVLSA